MGCFGRLLAAIGLLIVLVVAAAWQSDDAKAQVTASDPGTRVDSSIDQLKFLDGTWVGMIGESTVEETWTLPRSGNVIGMFRWFNPDESIQVLEMMSVNIEDGGVIYRMRHFDRILTPWASEAERPVEMRAAEITDASVRWEPLDADDNLAAITYTVESRDLQHREVSPVMRIEVSFDEETGRSPLRFQLTRTQKN